MMKFTHAVNAVVASVLVAPAILLQSRHGDPLEQGLLDTVRALEQLTDWEKGWTAGVPLNVADVLEATEPETLGGAASDERLVELRESVARLHAELDMLETPEISDVSGPLPAAPKAPEAHEHRGGAPTASLARPIVATTGLSEDQRVFLSAVHLPTATSRPRPTPLAAPAPEKKEPSGFTADPILEGRALYRAGRFAEALGLLEPLKPNVGALYWCGRSLEKLGRIEEALANYREVVQSGSPGYEADHAREDIAFLEWKLAFTKGLPSAKGPAGK